MTDHSPDAAMTAPALNSSQLEQGSSSKSTQLRYDEGYLRFEPLAPQPIKRRVLLHRRCTIILSIYPQGYNVKAVSPQSSPIPPGPPPSRHIEHKPDGWVMHKHPYGHIYYTHQDPGTPTLRLVTYSGPEAGDTLGKARKEIITYLESHGGVLPPKSHLVVILYDQGHPQKDILGGYYFADLQQKVIFWYVTPQ